ncbi:MAG: hypothetical protein COS89_06610 [Deltaproteobacteria bacterium CG07_land_8_20_14_0_80_38_7]|nr:MAG: hypothetical protein COS89_06610 [Deltaproteobacteria bacterium CG07_land_8_20_14_0_80_38_7]
MSLTCYNITYILHFAFNSDHIDLKENNQLRDIAQNFAQNNDCSVIVEGHTDSIGSERYNVRLSQKRAERVKQYLIWFGANKDQITVQYYGETKPIDTNKTTKGRTKNRRVVIHY